MAGTAAVLPTEGSSCFALPPAGRKVLQRLRPSTAIIEEASQLTEPTVVDVIAQKLGSIKMIILGGDIHLFGPKMTSINVNELYDSEKMSLFERFL